MNDKLLYFPYINVPENQWTIKSLLYWNSVGIIVPPNYMQNPQRYDAYTRNLLQTDLVEQIFPIQYITQVNGFENGFLKLTEHPQFNVEKRRLEFENAHYKLIHVQKFGDCLLERLIELGIAKRKNGEWYYVESRTASLIMLYLATFIGQVGNFTPATDCMQNLRTGIGQYRMRFQLNKIRQRLIDDLIPYPVEPDLTQLRRFKDKYYGELKSFRILIERDAFNISKIRSIAERNTEHRLIIAEINDKREKILNELKQAKFRLSFGTICGITAGVLGFNSGPFAAMFSIAGAVASVLQGNNQKSILREDYSYLALVDKEWMSQE